MNNTFFKFINTATDLHDFELEPQDVGVDSGQIVFIPDSPKFKHFSYPPAQLAVERGVKFDVFVKRIENERIGWFIATTESERFSDCEYVGPFICYSDVLLVIDPCYINFTEDNNYTEPMFREFYNKVCNITLERDFGLVEHDDFVCAASNTAWGDGVYNCYVQKKEDNKVTTVIIKMF